MTTLPSRLRSTLLLVFLLVLALALTLPTVVNAQSATVQVVLFYSPFCGHCQQVISEALPPIVQTYNTSFVWSYFGELPDEESGQSPPIVAFEGDVLQILYVDTTTEVGNQLYMANVDRFQIPADDQVVPIMVVGEQLLIGGLDIPNQLPGLIDMWLTDGGLSWPDIPGLDDKVKALVLFPDQVAESPTPSSSGSLDGSPTQSPGMDTTDQAEQGPSFALDVSKLTVLERVQLDPVGNTLSIVVLIGMLFSLVAAGMRWRLTEPRNENQPLPTAILVLVLLGIGVAGYLSFVATSGTDAVCGPVGDCNTVQASEYSHIFGIIPNGILGLMVYFVMLAAFVVSRRSSIGSDYADMALFGMALFGTLFSIYLTFLEPFVIGATCMWCLSSAVIITAIMLLSVDRAHTASIRLRP